MTSRAGDFAGIDMTSRVDNLHELLIGYISEEGKVSMLEGVRFGYMEGEDGVRIHVTVLGEGEPLLLIHGYPETSAMWNKVAPELAKRYTVVACDLRGYGESDKPHAQPDHYTYCKKMMAADLVKVMHGMGYDRFAVMGHDRGARVAYRMALEWPEVVSKLVLLDIVSTIDMYGCGHPDLCKAIFHWYFLPQEEPLVENLIMGDRVAYLNKQLGISAPPWEDEEAAKLYPDEVYQEYDNCFDALSVHGTTEDYRAGYTWDRKHDEWALAEGRKITAPTMAIWGSKGLVEKYFDPIECWSKYCTDLRGCTVDSGHFIPEENPEGLLQALKGFLL